MPGKRIEDLSDDELDKLSAEELQELESGIDTVEDDNVSDDGGDEDETLGDDNAAGGEEEEEEEEAGDGEPPTREQLEALANAEEGEEEEGAEGEDVPYARFREKNEEARDLRGILKAVLPHIGGATTAPAATAAPEREESPRPVFDFKAANREYTRLLSEGDTEAANTKLDEIEEAREKAHQWDIEKARADAEERAVTRVKTAEVQSKMGEVTTQLYKDFPFLDNKSAKADAAAIVAVNAEAKRLIAGGMDAPAALQKAGETLGKRFAKLIAVEAPAKDKKTDKDGKPAKAPDGKDPRSEAARKRNLDVRQPPSQKAGVGNRDEPAKVKDISKMSDAELDKLSPEELAELRGDNRVPADD